MSDVQALQEQIELEKAKIAQRDMAIRLAKNPDFRKLILDEFCVKEAARYVQTSADPAMGPQERADALAIAQATGHFKRWMSIQFQMGAHAERTLKDLEDEIEQARAEEALAESEEA